MNHTATAAALAIILASPAHAGMFKCTDASGQVTYSQTKCEGPVDIEVANIPTDARDPEEALRARLRAIENIAEVEQRNRERAMARANQVRRLHLQDEFRAIDKRYETAIKEIDRKYDSNRFDRRFHRDYRHDFGRWNPSTKPVTSVHPAYGTATRR